jgi:hypothetical protein
MANHQPTLITKLEWGRITVDAGAGPVTFKDCKVWPGGAVSWNWQDTSTEHEPGIQPADLVELLEKGIEVMVLSRGQNSRLGVCSETEVLLRERGIEVHILDTPQAVEMYNDLARRGRRVAGVFHSTC